jgi:hypothetical protein
VWARDVRPGIEVFHPLPLAKMRIVQVPKTQVAFMQAFSHRRQLSSDDFAPAHARSPPKNFCTA